MQVYTDPFYGEYIRRIPPVNWAEGKPEHERVASWQQTVDRSTSRMNESEFGRPISFLDWLYRNYPQVWLDRAYPSTGESPTDAFLRRRVEIWQCYGPEHGYIAIHPSEKKDVYLLLRVLCGPIIERSEHGGVRWHDVTLSDYGMQLRANTKTGRAILETVWRRLTVPLQENVA